MEIQLIKSLWNPIQSPSSPIKPHESTIESEIPWMVQVGGLRSLRQRRSKRPTCGSAWKHSHSQMIHVMDYGIFTYKTGWFLG